MESTKLSSDFAKTESFKYDREKEVKTFDESKAGVKGLVDAGIVKIPPFFVIPEDEVSSDPSPELNPTNAQIPVIDMNGMREDIARRKGIIEEIQHASATYGFFQVVNHGMPEDVMEEMVEGVRRFHEGSKEMKMEYYSRSNEKKVRFKSNLHLYKVKAADWRDTLYFFMAPDAPAPEEFPEACREVAIKFAAHVKDLGLALLELLSEALGLDPNYLIDIECAKGQSMMGHYYPPCPEPHLTLGTKPHKDPSFLTILLQDHIGGLQVFHQNQWIHVPPIPGAFVVNIGDLLQLISNDMFKSAPHRVLANNIDPRISVACFLATHFSQMDRVYGPIKELASDVNPPLYREIRVIDYVNQYCLIGLDGATSILDHFRL